LSIQTVFQATFNFLTDLPIIVEPSRTQLTSDAGLLVFRELDQHLGFTEQFANALSDVRDVELIDHTMLEMVRARVYGVLADYEDQNDHDTLRHDPLFKVLADRAPDDSPLASQPTLSRFENSLTIASLRSVRDVFIDQFIASFTEPPLQLTLDLDAVDDTTHGAQQLTLYNGYFDQYQYFPMFITCAENDLFVTISLRHGTAHAALGADVDLEYLVRRLRAVWPNVRIHVRGDAGYGMPWMYAVCERLDLYYTFGLTANTVLQARTAELLTQAVADCEANHRSARLFDVFEYQAGTWPIGRTVVVKAEANTVGTNRRFVVTNRPGAWHYPEACYDAYAERGESENRNKEFKVDMAMDRLSDHRFMANYFRLYLHACALNLLVRLRQVVADPPPITVVESPLFPNSAPAMAPSLPSSAPNATPEPLPLEAQPATTKKRYYQRRRQEDPLGEGQPCTWRSLVIKVAAEISVRSRRILVRLSSSWANLDYFQHVCQRLFEHIRPVVPTG
jgi:Transposase DDE domain group 1